MLAELEAIRTRTPDENMYLGDLGARKAKRALEAWKPADGLEKRWSYLWVLGQMDVRLGQEEEAVKHLKAAYDLIPEVKEKIGDSNVEDTILQLAIAYLRLGEVQNCCARNNPDSCIAPIRGAGIHMSPEGSTAAIKYLGELLDRPELGPDRSLVARYLLNIAYMTIGEYPDSVPIRWRLPSETFVSEIDFPKFPNISSKLGVDTFDNCGGAIVDDFNGDGYLDIFTTTYDAGGDPHLFLNDRKSGFVDRTQAAGLKGLYGGLNALQADYDNDGDVDVLILRGAWLENMGRHPRSLLANDGQGHFSDVTFDVGLGDVYYPAHSAAWADFDNDGDLDLYVANESTEAQKIAQPVVPQQRRRDFHRRGGGGGGPEFPLCQRRGCRRL